MLMNIEQLLDEGEVNIVEKSVSASGKLMLQYYNHVACCDYSKI